MNFLRRAITTTAGTNSLSSLSSRNRHFLLQQFSLSSTANTRYKSQSAARKPKTLVSDEESLPPPPTYPGKKSVDWPKPSEIPWQGKVANTVNLIGKVQTPVEFKSSSDGNSWAGTIIAQENRNSPSSLPSVWIPVIFEGDLAHIAQCHLRVKDYVYISGELNSDIPKFNLTEGQANVQIMVHSLNFVQGSSESKRSFVPSKSEEPATSISARKRMDSDAILKSWKLLVENPKQWMDYREKKRDGLVHTKYPDFKNMDSGDALWLNTAPEWVLDGLGQLEFCDRPSVKGLKDDDWKDLVENSSKWWDNRADKLNVKSPDFKNKESGKGLWLNDAPAWVLSSLPPLKAKLTDEAKRKTWVQQAT